MVHARARRSMNRVHGAIECSHVEAYVEGRHIVYRIASPAICTEIRGRPTLW